MRPWLILTILVMFVIDRVLVMWGKLHPLDALYNSRFQMIIGLLFIIERVIGFIALVLLIFNIF